MYNSKLIFKITYNSSLRLDHMSYYNRILMCIQWSAGCRQKNSVLSTQRQPQADRKNLTRYNGCWYVLMFCVYTTVEVSLRGIEVSRLLIKLALIGLAVSEDKMFENNRRIYTRRRPLEIQYLFHEHTFSVNLVICCKFSPLSNCISLPKQTHKQPICRPCRILTTQGHHLYKLHRQ